MFKNDRWFKPAVIILGILIVLGLFGNIYFLLRKEKQAPPIPQPVPTPIEVIATPTIDPTMGWKTYSKDFSDPRHPYPIVEIKYPSEWIFKEESLEGTADKQITFLDTNNKPTFALCISEHDFLKEEYNLQSEYLGPLTKEIINNLTAYHFQNKHGYLDAWYFPSINGYGSVQLLDEQYRKIYNQTLSTFRFD